MSLLLVDVAVLTHSDDDDQRPSSSVAVEGLKSYGGQSSAMADGLRFAKDDLRICEDVGSRCILAHC